MDVKKEIKMLAKEMETNQLLSYELSGYMKDSDRRKIFRGMAKHQIIPKKKYTYVDQGDGVGSQSGKFLVQNKADKIAPQGYVWGIKAYGQRGRPVGEIKKIIKEYQKSNETLKKGVIERSLKNRRK